MDKSRPEYREGKRRLKSLLGRAKAELRKQGRNMESVPKSLLGMSLMEHVKESKIDSLVVYEEGAGKWYADIAFKGLPIGVPAVFGTPTHMPKSSKEEAEKEAFTILVMILSAIKERDSTARDSKTKDRRVFELFGHSFSIEGKAIDEAAALASALGMEEHYDEAAAQSFLEKVLNEMCGDREFDGAIYDSASEELQRRLLTAMSLMLIFGEFRYPQRRAQGS